MIHLHFSLLVLTIALAVFDFRTRRAPNWVTLPLLLCGLLLYFPGSLETWLGVLLLFTGWRLGALGGGDAKLWMALLWLVPPGFARPAFLVMAAAFAFTALAQVIWRKVRGRAPFGLRTPGVWRAIPFTLWLLLHAG